MAQATTICDAARFIVSDEPVEDSLYFELDELDSGASTLRIARVIPGSCQ
jgi:hypothetical protein